MNIGFRTNLSSYYSSVESIFGFLRVNFVESMLGSTIANSFVHYTNFTDKATLDHVLKNKDTNFIPTPTTSQLESIILENLSIYEFESLTTAELEDKMAEATIEYETRYTTDKTTENKHTIPEKWISYSITNDFDLGVFDTRKFDNYDVKSLAQDNAFRVVIMENRYKYNGEIVFGFESSSTSMEIMSNIYNIIPINKYFFVNPVNKFKIVVPETFLYLMKDTYGFADRDETLVYLQKISAANVYSEQDKYKNIFKGVFFKYFTDPIMKITSMEYDKTTNKVKLSFELEVILPSRIMTQSTVSSEMIGNRLVVRKNMNISAVMNISKRIMVEFLETKINEDTNSQFFRYISRKYNILFYLIDDIEANKEEFVIATISFINDSETTIETLMDIYNDNLDFIGIDEVEYNNNYNPEIIANRILNFDKTYCEMYKTELELSDSDINDLDIFTNVYVVDKDSIITEEESEFVSKYVTTESVLYNIDIKAGDSEAQLVSSNPKGEEFTIDENYKLVKNIYVPLTEKRVNYIDITDTTLILNFENPDADYKYILQIGNEIYTEVTAPPSRVNDTWRIIAPATINDFAEINFYTRIIL